MRHEGSCHCGNVTVAFESQRPPAESPLRTCLCTFCRKHGNTAITDPAGRLEIAWRDEGAVSRYVFGLRTSEFVICRTCGVFVGAICELDGKLYATLNANVLGDRAAFTQAPSTVDYDAEDVAARLARRRRMWTPATAGP